MREKQFQAKFNQWLKKNWTKGTAVFELKLARTKALPFSSVRDTQFLGLDLASNKNKKLVYKISDESRGDKPFDCFCIHKALAYIVIMYYKRGQKEFVMVDIDSFIKEMNISKRKSLTEIRAKEIGIIYSLI